MSRATWHKSARRLDALLERAFGALPNGPGRRKLIGWLLVSQGVGLAHEILAGHSLEAYARIAHMAPIETWAGGSIAIGAFFALTTGRYRPHILGRLAALLVLVLDAWFWGGFWAAGSWVGFWYYSVILVVVFGELVYVPPSQTGGG